VIVKPGDTVPVRDLTVTVVAAEGRRIQRKGEPNAHCDGIPLRDEPAPGENSSENPASVGIVVEFGKFRFANLGDLTWNKEFALLCPEDRLGRLDLYQAAGHGRAPTKAMTAVAPRVVVASNGADKGAGAGAFKAFRALPGLEDLWLLHFNVAGGDAGNPPREFVANLGAPEGCEGHFLKVSARQDGSFTLFNSRTGETKTYAARQSTE
jgi:hypothetical protein